MSAPCWWPPPARTETRPVQALTPEELIAAQALIRRVPVGESVVDAILRLVRGGRPETSDDRRSAGMSPGGPVRAPPRR